MGNFMNLRVFALLGVLLLAGCSGLSVRHLPSNPWKNEASQNIQMRYLAFQYQVIPVGNELGIVAEAYPVIDKLPDWASWYGEIMLSVYVSDEYGRVLASKDTVLVPRPLNREAGLPLETRPLRPLCWPPPGTPPPNGTGTRQWPHQTRWR